MDYIKILKELQKEYLLEFNEKEAGETWTRQGQIFRDFWDNVLSSRKLLSEDIDYHIRFLDSHAKGIAESEIEPIGRSLIPQGSWRRIFEEFSKNSNLYQLVTSILRCEKDEERIELLNKLFSINTDKNRLTGKQANMINDLMFVYAPDRNTSILSIEHRFKIMDMLNIGAVSSIKQKSWGEQIVQTKQEILSLIKDLPFSNFRSLSRFFYYPSVRKLWNDQEIVSDDDAELDDRLEGEGFFDVPVSQRKILTQSSEPTIKDLCNRIDKGKLITQAEFQRKYVWDSKPKLKSRLIESVLLQVPDLPLLVVPTVV